jgi:hypothetical protein
VLVQYGHEKVRDGGIIAGSSQVENVKGINCYPESSVSLGIIEVGKVTGSGGANLRAAIY